MNVVLSTRTVRVSGEVIQEYDLFEEMRFLLIYERVCASRNSVDIYRFSRCQRGGKGDFRFFRENWVNNIYRYEAEFLHTGMYIHDRVVISVYEMKCIWQ
jgi:hypothetical protein